MRARTVVEHNLFQGHDQPTYIACPADLSQATEPRQHVAFRHAVTYKDADLLMGGGRRVLKHRVQLFVELLARAHASKFNLNVFTRPQPREQNQVSGQIDDLDRLAHIEDANLATLADHRGLQHELAGFWNGHEEAPHFGMGYGHRPASRDLLLEDRNNATIRAQHVAEAHGDVLGAPVLQRQKQQFGDAFRGTHDVGRPHRLVGGDHDEVFDSVLGSG